MALSFAHYLNYAVRILTVKSKLVHSMIKFICVDYMAPSNVKSRHINCPWILFLASSLASLYSNSFLGKG